jgi:hypothetical protein
MAEPVVLREFNSRAEAEVIREFLVANGVEAFLASDDCGSMDPAFTFVRGVQLYVSSDDVARAEQMLEEGLIGATADETPEEPTNP